MLQTRDLQVLKEWVVRGGRRKERIEHVVEARESDGQQTWEYRNKNKNVASTCFIRKFEDALLWSEKRDLTHTFTPKRKGGKQLRVSHMNSCRSAHAED